MDVQYGAAFFCADRYVVVVFEFLWISDIEAPRIRVLVLILRLCGDGVSLSGCIHFFVNFTVYQAWFVSIRGVEWTWPIASRGSLTDGFVRLGSSSCCLVE